jgi:multicomponent K+:H+ antiporter subunit G
VLHELLIAIFVTATTPISLMILVRAAAFRDESERKAPSPSTGGNER